MSARTNKDDANGTRRAARVVIGGLVAAGVAMAAAMAAAQEQPAKPAAEPWLLESVGKWFEEQTQKLDSTFKEAGKGVENFGREAGIAARTGVEGTKDAAGAVARIPAVRVIEGREKCKVAPNGAADCQSAAVSLCKARGFETGKSADLISAETCSPQVYLAGRSSGPGCKTETFLSRALCQ